MKTFAGSCLCGKVKYRITTEYNAFFLCHCLRCQKKSGSAHAANLFSKPESFQWISGDAGIKTYKVPDTRFASSFCQECGSPVPTVGESGRVVVPAGSLDTPLDKSPTAHIFVASRASWDLDLEKVMQFDGLPKN